jgi:glycosyltransferase involved in cell wall biosynthesis
MRIAVCRPQVPFAHGGAEIFTDTLVAELRARGHEADVVSVPYKWYPAQRVLSQAFLWRLLDLSETDGTAIDLVVATKFPSYVVRHPEKRVWLVHQFRQAYELDGTDLGQFGDDAADRALRRKVNELDRIALGEATRLFAISGNVAGRLARSTGLTAEVVRHPPQTLDYHCAERGRVVLSASRLDRAKRIDLLVEAAAHDPSLEIVVVSDGPDRERLEALAASHNLGGRLRFEGRVSGERLAELYASCAAVYYAPVDEDYGMGPYESFLSSKPVITTVDAGGPLDVVHDRGTGLVVRAHPAEIARAAVWLRDNPHEAARLGEAGKALAEEITWDRAIGRLLS